MGFQLNIDKLIEEAKEAQKRSHSPYSDFRVGASLLTEGGEIFSACNVEAKPSANTLHAEQRVIGKAVEEGHTEYVALALVTDGDSFLPPCGNCRQTLATFQEDLVIFVSSGDEYKKFELEQLLPDAYTGRSMEDAPTDG